MNVGDREDCYCNNRGCHYSCEYRQGADAFQIKARWYHLRRNTTTTTTVKPIVDIQQSSSICTQQLRFFLFLRCKNTPSPFFGSCIKYNVTVVAIVVTSRYSSMMQLPTAPGSF